MNKKFVFALLCCLLVFVSACSSAPNTGTQPSPTAVATAYPVPPKSDANGVPSEAALRQRLAKVQELIQKMSLEEKLGQLLIVEYVGKSYTSELRTMITQQFVGGYMYQEVNHNFEAPYNVASNVKSLSSQTMKDARIPLLIATDQEGGYVNRLYQFHGPLPSAETLAASGKPDYVKQQATQTAKWLLELGVNVDLAPVVDVRTIEPPSLPTRMFGRDPQTVVTYAGAFLDGLQQNNVMGTLKHFPGLGAANSDPHFGLPVVNRSKADLDKIDFAPYKSLIQQKNPAMIMSTDVLMTAVDADLPAELSPKVIDGVLRGELGYNGVVITDGLYMEGISKKWNIGEASVLSILAGNDLVEGPFTVAQVAAVVSALKQAIQNKRLTEERINLSLQRILLMKMDYGLIK
jgi:beta-N-acetylhexosaminidase